MMRTKDWLNTILSYWELTKPRITVMVLVTTSFGYYLGVNNTSDLFATNFNWVTLLNLLFGSMLASGGVSAINEYLERNWDSKMSRTHHRPIPSGRISSVQAKLFGYTISTVGVIYLGITTNLLVSILTALTVLLYLFIYTPLKRITILNTLAGAIPGAMPPLGGWAAATGELDVAGWVLFGILFFWQIPHFLSIAILYQEDYKLGGFKMLPVVYPNTHYTYLFIIFFTVSLLGASLSLYFLNSVGVIYAFGAAILGLGFLFMTYITSVHRTRKVTRKLLITSLIYLPALFIVAIIDISLIN